MADRRMIQLRYPARCSTCGTALPARTKAWWDRDTKLAQCVGCGDTDMPSSPGEPLASLCDPPTPSAPSAGASAQHEYERRKAKRERDTRSRLGRLGGVVLAVADEPQSTKAWAKGAAGERRLGAKLDELRASELAVLHDRRIPGSRVNIDHLVVAPTGVWVVDTKCYAGRLALRDKGGWFSSDRRLYVGRRDRTKLVQAMDSQLGAVRQALGAAWHEVPVWPVLCFVDVEVRWFAKPFEIDGVLVTWPKPMYRRLTQPGPYTRDGIKLVAEQLGSQLKPAA